MWPEVELRELHVFLAVADELHFGRAAERIAIHPSRVSQVVRELETKLGARVFDRTSRRVRLTPIGERFRASVMPLCQQVDRAVHDIRDLARGAAGVLRIGIYSPSATGEHMVNIIRTFKERHPGADVEFINTGLDRSYLAYLRHGQVDALAIRLPLTEPDVTVGPVLSREPRVLLIAKDDPLAARRSAGYEDIANRVVSDVPAFPREMLDAFVPPTTPSGRRLRRITNHDTEEMVMRVALGEQVHPTVPSMLNHITHPAVTSVPIRDLPPSETALAWLTANDSALIAAFAHAAADVLAQTDLGRAPAGAGSVHESAV